MDPFLLGLRSALFQLGGAETVSFQAADGGPPIADIRAIRAQAEAGDIPGLKATIRTTTFEIAYASIADRPRKDDRIDADDGGWVVVQVLDKSEVGAWLLAVERAAP